MLFAERLDHKLLDRLIVQITSHDSAVRADEPNRRKAQGVVFHDLSSRGVDRRVAQEPLCPVQAVRRDVLPGVVAGVVPAQPTMAKRLSVPNASATRFR